MLIKQQNLQAPQRHNTHVASHVIPTPIANSLRTMLHLQRHTTQNQTQSIYNFKHRF